MRLIFLFVLLLLNSACDSNDTPLPNIVWLTTEDNAAQHMDLYSPGAAAMPNLEKLAQEGVVFNHAFSNAPVCSVARSTMITGCYAPRIFTQYHRRTQRVPLPEGVMPFPYYLKEAGYYTTNNNKEDYNFILPKGVWDESSKKASYKNRKSGQPFFHIQNHTVSHEQHLHFDQSTIDDFKEEDLQNIEVFPYHPDTKTFRYTYYHFHNRLAMADQQMGKFIQDLKDQGLMENTIIFYFGDHGGLLPRSKGFAYESGLQVPLIVYYPPKWEHLFQDKKGSRSNTFFEFIDFAPSVLSLAGIAPPEPMDGTPVFGKYAQPLKVKNKNNALGHADRFDEKYDMVRTLRVGKYKYIRNYQPFNTDALFNFYRYKMLAFQEWDALYLEGKLNPEQQQYFKQKNPEALYNLEEDPHEIKDLSQEVSHQEILKSMRKQLQNKLLDLPDLSFYPESFLLENALQNPVAFGQKHQSEIEALMAIADLSLTPFDLVSDEVLDALRDKNPWKRYWALIVCTSFGEKAKSLMPQIKNILEKDTENLVRIRAIEFLALNGIDFDKSIIEEIMKNAVSETEAILMLNSLALIVRSRPDFKINLTKDIFPAEWSRNPKDLISRRMQYLVDNL